MTQLIRSGLPELPSLSDDKMEASLRPLYVAINQLAKQCSTLFSSSLSIDVGSMTRDQLQSLSITANYSIAKDKLLIITAGETMGYGNIVYGYKDTSTGLLRVKKFDNISNTAGVNDRLLVGIVVEPSGMTAGVKGRIMVHDGILTNLTGVVPGKRYWAGNAGNFTSAAPYGAVNPYEGVAHPIGLGLDANNMLIRLAGFIFTADNSG